MLIGIFKSNQKITNGLVFLLVFLLWIPAFFSEIVVVKFFSTNIRWLDVVLLIFLIAGQSIYLNFIVSNYKLVKDNSHLTSLIFVVLNSCFFSFSEINKIALTNTFVLVAFHQLLKMYDSKNNYTLSFNAGALIGLSGLIYFPSLIYFILLWIVLFYATTPSWRAFIISLIGLSVPVIYFIVYKFILGSLSSIKFNDYLTRTFSVNWENFTLYNQLFLMIVSVILILALLNFFITIGNSVVKISKMLVTVFLMFLFGLVTLFINEQDTLATFLMLSIPLAIIIANFFQNMKKKWLAEVLFACLLFSVTFSYLS